MSKVTEIVEQIAGLTVTEAVELVSTMEEYFDISAEPVYDIPHVASVEEVEEQFEFDVVLTAVGSEKIQVVKWLRKVTSLGLREAKDLVDSAPATLEEGVTKERAKELKRCLEDVGATIEIK